MRKISDVGLIHLVQDRQGGVHLATKEGVLWVDLNNNPLVMVEDLGVPQTVVVEMNRMKHCLKLFLGQVGPSVVNLISLVREVIERK